MTDRALQELHIEAHQRVAVAFAADVDPAAAVALAQRIGAHLDREAVSVARRCYIIGSGAGFDDTGVALLLTALEPIVDPATLMLHDPDDADALWFHRRPPGVVRGGIFLSRAWMGAGVRIAVGDPAQVLAGLAAWFVPHESLDPQADLNADVILTPD